MISERYLEQLKTRIGCSAPGPARDEMQAEYDKCASERTAQEAQEARAAAAGFLRNKFAGKCATTGIAVPELGGFTRKEAGKWRTYSWDAALALVEP